MRFPGSDDHYKRNGRRRVEAWYGDLDEAAAVEFSKLTTESAGLLMWRNSASTCRWPAWHADDRGAVATINAPVGFESVVPGPVDEKSAWALTDALAARPSRIFDLTPPVVIATMDEREDRLRLFTDALGVGRLYSLRCSWGMVWSNRPVAAIRFADVSASASIAGWRSISAVDWPIGSTTAYEGVEAVPAATYVNAMGGVCTSTSQDVLEKLLELSARGLDACLESAANDLSRTAASMKSLWAKPPKINLSGGRDSRLVAAAFLASGSQPHFRTIPSFAEEVAIARELMDITGTTELHTVTGEAAKKPVSGRVLRRGVRWHRATEGHAATNSLYRRSPSESLRHRPGLRISGSGGDFAHGFYLPPDVTRIERYGAARRRQAWSAQLQSRILLPRGLARHSIELVAARIEEILAEAAAHGVDDSRAITWFYLTERLRRWASRPDSGTGRPLLTTRFAAAAFAARGDQLKDSMIHRRLIAELVPEWADVPYFSASLVARDATVRVFPWDEVDRDDITALLLDPSTEWREPFNPDAIVWVWSAALQGNAAARDDQLLQRVLWRATFADHLQAVNGESGSTRSPSSSEEFRLHHPSRSGSSLARLVATKANDWRPAQRLARTRLGKAIRRRIGV